MKPAAALALVLAACAGETGTIQLELVAAPGSPLLDSIQHLRVTLTEPRQVVEADRTDSGFLLALDVEATGGAGALIVEGFDGNGGLIAGGESPVFPVAAINARIVVYLAAPLTIGSSIAGLPAARTGVASALLDYRVAIAGGEDAAGTKTDAILVYNAYDHALTAGTAMPAPRAFQTLASGPNGAVYLFGGVDAANQPTGTLWRFETNVPPSGAYIELPEIAALARSGTSAIQLGIDRYVITGAPPIDLATNAIQPRADLAALAPNGASVVAGNEPIALFAGDPIVRMRDDAFDTVAATAEPEATAVALPDGRIAFVGAGGTRDLLVVDPAAGTSTRVIDALSEPRRFAAAAASTEFLVVAGGTDPAGASLGSADIFDVTDLAKLATVPCAARAGARAHVLPNRQILILGGAPANDEIELFTPPPAIPD